MAKDSKKIKHESDKKQNKEQKQKTQAEQKAENAALQEKSKKSAIAEAVATGMPVDASKRSKKERKIIKTTDKKEETLMQKLGGFVVPLIALFIFFLLVIFVFVPVSNDIMATRADTDSIRQQVDKNHSKVETLKSINGAELSTDLNTVSKVVRNDMDVSELAAQVEDVALENDLHPSELNFSDEQVSVVDFDIESDFVREVPDYARSISGPFGFYGDFEDVTSFLSDLRNESPTILALSKIEVSRYVQFEEDEEGEAVENTEEELWSVKIIISGYLTSEVESVTLEDPVSVDTNEEILEEIKNRVLDTDNSDTSESSN